jgi:mannosyltransferase
MPQPGKSEAVDPGRVEVIAPNFKRRLSGVTSTIVQLVPLQATMIGMATLGPGLPGRLPRLRWWQVPALLRRPAGRPFRIWHARRNVEMLAGVVLRDVFRAPLRLVFTSASQRRHRRWTKFLIRRMDAVVATSAKTASYLEVPHTVVMHGIDLERFSPATDREAARRDVGLDPEMRYIGCFGRIRRQKGTDLFVDAMIDLLPGRPGWGAIVAGRATAQHVDFDKALRRKVEAAGLADRILFVGEHRDIERWYRALDLFVAPQRWEGFGLTPLEAMASGVPVVATDVGAFPEMVEEGVTGRLIAADDLRAMIEAVDEFVVDDECLLAAGRAAPVHVRKSFQLVREAGELVSVYERLWMTSSASASSSPGDDR